MDLGLIPRTELHRISKDSLFHRRGNPCQSLTAFGSLSQAATHQISSVVHIGYRARAYCLPCGLSREPLQV